jgi:hypothetical protein
LPPVAASKQSTSWNDEELHSASLNASDGLETRSRSRRLVAIGAQKTYHALNHRLGQMLTREDTLQGEGANLYTYSGATTLWMKNEFPPQLSAPLNLAS